MKREVIRHSPILGEVSHIRQHEGHHWTLSEREEEVVNAYDTVSAEMTMTREELKGDFDSVFGKFSQMAESFASQQTKRMFEKISEAAESVGNVVSTKGELTQDALLEVMEKVQVELDPETRKPKNSFFVMHPDMAEKTIAKVNEWERDPKFQKKIRELEERQWMAWRDRESRRRLVD